MFNIKTSITVNNNVFTESSPVPLTAAGTTQCWLIALLCLSFCGINCQSLQLHWWSSGRHDRVGYSLAAHVFSRTFPEVAKLSRHQISKKKNSHINVSSEGTQKHFTISHSAYFNQFKKRTISSINIIMT